LNIKACEWRVALPILDLSELNLVIAVLGKFEPISRFGTWG
jgi:hypothetical protein